MLQSRASNRAGSGALQWQAVPQAETDPEFPSDEKIKEPVIAPSSSRRVTEAAAICLVLFAYIYTYHSSLTGGTHSRDLAFINAHISFIGAHIIVSVLAFTASAWATALHPQWRREVRWAIFAALLSSFLAFLAYDHGNDFQFHGQYNWMVFLIIGTPLNLVLLGFYWWWRSSPSPKHFAISFITAIATVAIACTIALSYYRHEWYAGFLGEKMLPGCSGPSCSHDTVNECNFLPNLPFVDLLPNGAQNFWTGSQKCKSSYTFEATFSSEGLLTINKCGYGQATQYALFADTRHYTWEEKTHEHAAFQTRVLQELIFLPYEGPIEVAAEAVLARCGESEQLLLRVAKVESRRHAPLLTRSETNDRSTPQKLNVLFLFLDAVSRRHFFRRLPKTVETLEQIHISGVSQLHQFFRYHSVGLSTDPNSRAFYTGTMMNTSRTDTLWKAFRKAGYIVGRADELCEDWNVEYNGQSDPRVDHELIAPMCLPEYHPIDVTGEPYRIFQGAYSILKRCLRGKHVHQHMIDYTKAFIKTYARSNPFFLTSTFLEGHEGTGEVVAQVDEDLAEMLAGLGPDVLGNTAVVLMSDHGLHMGLNLVYTENGRVEHQTPFLAMLLPPWVTKLYPNIAKSLEEAQQRLVTGFDIFTTMNHLLHLVDEEGNVHEEQQEAEWAKSGNFSEALWGSSLLAGVPESQTCSQANIPEELCRCI